MLPLETAAMLRRRPPMPLPLLRLLPLLLPLPPLPPPRSPRKPCPCRPLPLRKR